MREITSPQSFIDFGYYALIAMFLQRRVWSNANHQKLYPNIYPILVGDPGIGKGIVLKVILEFLKEHLQEDITNRSGSQLAAMSNDQIAQAAVEAKDTTETPQITNKPKYKIPIGADCTTYEALVEALAKQPRSKAFNRFDDKLQKLVKAIYRHNSLAFCLEELSSLITKDRSQTFKVVQFLIRAYDCGDYEYTTKTKGSFYIKGTCLNFLAGTTPKFIEDAFSEDILGDGFASRVWFVYGAHNRFYKLRSPELTTEQVTAAKELSGHLLKLTNLYGYVPFSPEADAYLAHWWEEEQCNKEYHRPNMSEKLNSYYSRKNIHVQKLAMILHFSEDAETMEDGYTPKNAISLETTKKAMSILDGIEQNMHLALNFAGINPLHKLTRKIHSYIKKFPGQSTDVLYLEFYGDIPGADPKLGLNQALDYLRESSQIYLDEKLLKWFAVKG